MRALTRFDKAVARFLFAVPLMYVLYWMGLLAGHLATSEVSPPREWNELLSVVVVGALTFAGILSTIELGVLEERRGHGLAVLVSGGMLSVVGVVAINGLVAHDFPFWLRFWQHDFMPSDIVLGSRFWSSHSPFFLWIVMILSVVLVASIRLVAVTWPEGVSGTVRRAECPLWRCTRGTRG